MSLSPLEDHLNTSHHENHEEPRTCWICFGTDEDNATMPWVKPCSCRGSGEWVHQSCLLLWIEEKRKENRGAKTKCPQCKVEYIIYFPKSGYDKRALGRNNIKEGKIGSQFTYRTRNLVSKHKDFYKKCSISPALLQCLMKPAVLAKYYIVCDNLYVLAPVFLFYALMSFIQIIDDFIYRASPIVAAGVTVGIIYWAATSYGAFTIVQIFGEDDGMRMLERVDPLALLVFLPTIPTALITLKLIKWEDFVLSLLRKGSKYPVLRHVLPTVVYNEVMGQQVEVKPPSESLCSTRIFVGALVFPTVAKICGEVFFHLEKSSLKKFFLGGLTFIAIKGVLKMYYKQRSYVHHNQRRVLNQGESREPKT